MEQAWRNWTHSPNNKRIKALSLLACWGIWLARNSAIFHNKPSIPEITVENALSILAHFPQDKDTPTIRVIQAEQIDSSTPWAYFDGASQNNNQVCGGGALLYLSAHHFFKIKMGLGPGTNNYVELMALKLLLVFAGEKGVKSIQIFGDSMIAINWIRKAQNCQNLLLLPLLEEIFRLLDSYDTFCVKHVYREHNYVADSLSKAGIHLPFGQWKISETRDQDFFEFYHMPFIDEVQSQE
jgi:ribonuclease HI